MMLLLKKIIKFLGAVFLGALALMILLLIYFNIPVASENSAAELGVTFSSRYASDIGLDWKEAYVAMLDDLKIRHIRLPIYWDLVEKNEGQYDFSDVDWQLARASERNAQVILVTGQKVPRWPECAIPERLAGQDEKRKEELLKFVSVTVERYKNNSEIKYWQVENEPFLPFGICPELDVALLDRELALVRAADPTRQIIVTDSGELSLWVRAASRADIFGTTMYRTIFKEGLGYFNYPIGPRFFQFKYWMNKMVARQDKAIVVELQAEPWISGATTEMPLSEQFKSMDSRKLEDNISFARKVGFPQIYLWGVEWWYWLKTKQNHPELWNTARNLFSP